MVMASLDVLLIPVGCMPNERLRAALLEHGLTPAALSEQIGVDYKTVERWISLGRVPYRRHRYAVAARLAVDEAYLWPDALSREQVTEASNSEVVAIYPHRSDVPHEVWEQLFSAANRRSGYSSTPGSSWPKRPPCRRSSPPRPAPGCGCGSCSVTRTARRWPSGAPMRAWGRAWPPGCVTRWCSSGRCAPPAARSSGSTGPPCTTRSSAATIKCWSMTHVYGLAGAYAPAWHLRRVAGGEIVSTYLDSFEKVWETAIPVPE